MRVQWKASRTTAGALPLDLSLLDVSLLAQGLPGLAEPLSPETLAAAHPHWAADVAAHGPWTLDEARGVWRPGMPVGHDVVLCGPCVSTMDVARELVEQGRLGPWGSVLTPMQTAGRGQLRRVWLSAPGNLLASLVCPPETGPRNDLRPLVLGHLFAEALSGLGGAVRVKWPNDLLLSDLKVGGMLVEERSGGVLAGLGLNLVWAPEPEALREDHSVAAGRFPVNGAGPGPLGLWLELVNRVETGYTALLETFSPREFLTIFRSRLAWMGRRVLVHEGAGVRYEAFVRGISEEGGLVLDHGGREVILLSGDVTPV